MVSFELSEDQKLLQETIAAFAVEQMRPLARDADERGAAPESVVAKAWDLGLVSSAIPESYGGFGDAPSALTGAIVLEELGYGDLSIALHVLAPRLLVYPLLEHGTEEQKKRLLPAFTQREFRAATAAVVEPSLHFDLSARFEIDYISNLLSPDRQLKQGTVADKRSPCYQGIQPGFNA